MGPASTLAAPTEAQPFDPHWLVNELLSLGNERITPRIAETIGREVQAELKRRSASRWTAELISEIVQFKLEEMGLVGIRHRHRRRPDSLPYLELPRGLFAEEATEFLPEETVDLDHSPAAPFQPLPPRAAVQVSLSGREALGALFPVPPEQREQEWQKALEQVARQAARAELAFSGEAEAGLSEVKFFNVMANQEFFPHHSLLLDAADRQTSGSLGTRIPLNAEIRSQAEALELSQNIWRKGGSVLFDLTTASGSPLDAAGLERFLRAVEKTFFQAPETAPPAVGWLLSAELSSVEEAIRLLLSGRFYPKFSLHLRVPENAFEPLSEENRAGLARIFQGIWKRGDLSLLLSPTSRPGGGPALDPWEACQFGTVNLAVLASGSDVDWIKLRRVLHTAVHFLDNAAEAGPYGSETVERHAKANRKLGIGVMGFAELLVKTGIPYDSDDAVTLAEKLIRYIQQETAAASETLAESRGAFPNYPLSPLTRTRRHATLTALIPAPFLAAVAGVTPGIEPLRSVPGTLLKQVSARRGMWSAELEEDWLRRESVRESLLAPKPLRRLFGIRSELDPEWEIKIQAALQRGCDGGVGHRLALPESPDLDPLFQALEQARACEIPLLTFKQNEGLEEIVEEIAAPVAEESPAESAEPRGAGPEPVSLIPRPRPEVLTANVRTVQTGCGPMTVSVAKDKDSPLELQARLGKAGGCASAQTEAISRLTTLLLSVGVDSRLIHEQLRGIRCPAPAVDNGERVLSCADAISKVLARELGMGKAESATELETPDIPEKIFAEEEEVTAIVAKDSLH
jgi:ribonucleoside-diphosphate reductase alpha chain